MIDYSDFIESKRRDHEPCGFDAPDPHPSLFDHQSAIVSWACRMGRCAIFADTGLGKTRMQLEWCRAVADHTGTPVLLIAPLAVIPQTIREAHAIGVNAGRAGSGCPVSLVNYERVDAMDVSGFGGVAIDESSILKSYDGATRTMLIEKFASTPYRLACTATPAPNDHTELGNHAEFLGVSTRTEMLAEFFVHDGSSSSARGWRIKGHAEADFWRWVATWSVVVRKPSDLGFADDGYDLPPLRIHQVQVGDDGSPEDGALFAGPAMGLNDQRRSRRATMGERMDAAHRIASESGPCIVWCELNDESSEASSRIADAVEVRGSDSPEDKADRLDRFSTGDARVIVTKPSIAGFGMNWQHCRRMVFIGATHSYESFYQAIRRCWRFGQTEPVDVYVIQTPQDGAIVANLARKADAADEMADRMVGMMRETQMESVRGKRAGAPSAATAPTAIPPWLVSEGPDACD